MPTKKADVVKGESGVETIKISADTKKAELKAIAAIQVPLLKSLGNNARFLSGIISADTKYLMMIQQDTELSDEIIGRQFGNILQTCTLERLWQCANKVSVIPGNNLADLFVKHFEGGVWKSPAIQEKWLPSPLLLRALKLHLNEQVETDLSSLKTAYQENATAVLQSIAADPQKVELLSQFPKCLGLLVDKVKTQNLRLCWKIYDNITHDNARFAFLKALINEALDKRKLKLNDILRLYKEVKKFPIVQVDKDFCNALLNSLQRELQFQDSSFQISITDEQSIKKDIVKLTSKANSFFHDSRFLATSE